MIHCLMGQSRSSAVAAAIYKIFSNQDDSYFFDKHTPNRKVYRTILKIAQQNGKFFGRENA